MWHHRARLLALLLPLGLAVGLAMMGTIVGEALGGPAAPAGGEPAGVTATPTPTRTPTRTPCPAPGCGVNFSIGVDANGDTTDDCSTKAGASTTCTLPLGATFRLGVYLNSLGGVSSYVGFDILLEYSGVGSKNDPDAHVWPVCDLEAIPTVQAPGTVAFGCLTFGGGQTYVGLIGVTGFNCTQTGQITLVHEDTTLVEGPGGAHHDGGGQDLLTINCNPDVTATPTRTPTPGPSPTATPTRTFAFTPLPTSTPGGPTVTPGGPTDTPTTTPPLGASPTLTPSPTPPATGVATATPTHTPLPPGVPSPTPTRTRPPTSTPTPPGGIRYGDVNCDELVNAVDGLFVLQFDVAIIAALPCRAAADVNADGVADARDALLILQFDVGIIDSLPAGRSAARAAANRR